MITPEEIAAILLKEKAVFLKPEDPFTWTSGIKSPVYCDNRLLISTVQSRKKIVQSFCEVVRRMDIQVVAGTATAGIPWAAWIAMELELPLVYVRSSQKDHGRQNAIEGSVTPGTKAVLIEDLISTGKSSIAAAQKLQDAEVDVEAVLSIFTYGFAQAEEVFSTAKISHQSLSNFETLSRVAVQEKIMDAKSLEQVLEWKKGVVFP